MTNELENNECMNVSANSSAMKASVEAAIAELCDTSLAEMAHVRASYELISVGAAVLATRRTKRILNTIGPNLNVLAPFAMLPQCKPSTTAKDYLSVVQPIIRHGLASYRRSFPRPAQRSLKRAVTRHTERYLSADPDLHSLVLLEGVQNLIDAIVTGRFAGRTSAFELMAEISAISAPQKIDGLDLSDTSRRGRIHRLHLRYEHAVAGDPTSRSGRKLGNAFTNYARHCLALIGKVPMPEALVWSIAAWNTADHETEEMIANARNRGRMN